uniref:Transposase n=1 Tax=Brugia timori TaxID=42155 RepID=A0A0R3R5T6_9BILA
LDQQTENKGITVSVDFMMKALRNFKRINNRNATRWSISSAI